MVVVDMGEYWIILGSHDHLHLFIFLSNGHILVINSGEKPSIKSHQMGQQCLSISMTKRIYLPTNSGLDSESFKQEFMTQSHLVNNILVISCCFIIHTPSTIYEFQLTSFDKIFSFVSNFFILIIPPSSIDLIVYILKKATSTQINFLVESKNNDLMTESIVY